MNETKLIKIADLEAAETKNGDTYYFGTDDNGKKFFVFKNGYKNNNNRQPDFNLMTEEDKQTETKEYSRTENDDRYKSTSTAPAPALKFNDENFFQQLNAKKNKLEEEPYYDVPF